MGVFKKNLIVVVGPTAVGKTRVSIQLAEHFQCDIISADSRQFYREMSTGTAKPTAEEMEGVRHYFVDSHSVTDGFSAGRFEVAALKVLKNCFLFNDFAIVTGGSGLYVQALCAGMNDIPQVPAAFRKKLYEEMSEKGLDQLVTELGQRDPVYLKRIDKKNQQRIIRALEVCRATGRPYSSFRDDKPRERNFNIIKTGLDLPREVLFERINARVDEMVAKGLFEEVEGLLPYRNTYALQTVGYREVFGYLDGHYDRKETIRLIKRNTRRYAKRQLTWFKRDPEIRWFHPEQKREIIEYIKKQVFNGR